MNEMEQSSIVIHKGGREDKYQIYVEDYVLSFLKEETGTLELSEFYFYGFREKNGRKYMIYGAGRNRGLAVFDKYDLLEEVGCRLTQAGPTFLIREENNTIYEINGYEVFYQDNREMQNYLINQKMNDTMKTQNSGTKRSGRTVNRETERPNRAINRPVGRVVEANGVNRQASTTKKTPHNVITVQLGVILLALVAIVINSTNSYDKMQELNQSAEEVFFAMENQEAEDVTPDDEKAEIVVERDVTEEEDILKLAALENEEQSENQSEKDAEAQTEARSEEGVETQTETQSKEDAVTKTEVQNKEDSKGQAEDQGEGETEQDTEGHSEDAAKSDGTEEVEALSRNVTRYYEVERGDTLYTISQKIYGDTAYVQKICDLNQITDPDNIHYGQKIILP